MKSATDEKSTQSKKFIETARAIGCDEDEAAFIARLGKLLSAPVKKEPTPAPKPKKAKHSK
jgi:hypothetical protein